MRPTVSTREGGERLIKYKGSARTAWGCAVHGLTWLYADTWLRSRSMSHAKFKVRIHLRALETRAILKVLAGHEMAWSVGGQQLEPDKVVRHGSLVMQVARGVRSVVSQTWTDLAPSTADDFDVDDFRLTRSLKAPSEDGLWAWRGHVVQFQVKMLGREPGARETSLRYEGRWLYLMDPVPCGSVASPMRFASKIALLLLAFLAALALGWLVFSKEGGCRPDPRPRPACHPGDKECNVDEPAGPSVPSIGKAP